MRIEIVPGAVLDSKYIVGFWKHLHDGRKIGLDSVDDRQLREYIYNTEEERDAKYDWLCRILDVEKMD